MSNYNFMGRTANRLCEETRCFAYESLHGKYGTDAINNSKDVVLDDIEALMNWTLSKNAILL